MVPSKLHTEDSSLVQERIQSFHILACEKDLTDLIDLEGVNMNSGDLRGAKGTMAPGQTHFVAEKGPRAYENIQTKSQKTFEYTLCFLLMLAGTYQTRGVGV